MIRNEHDKYSRLFQIKHFRRFMALILVICLFAVDSLKEYGPIVAEAAEDSQTTYVSDVRLFYALFSIDEAKKKCRESGFIPIEGDLNKGTDKNHVILGYKEAKDKKDAIYSIKLLSMDSGYELKDYSELLEQYKNTNAYVIDTIEAAAIEFTYNYKNGSPKAKEAYEGLNLINVPKVNNKAEKKLGDYIVDGDADWDFYADVVARASAGTINAIVGFLSLGLATYKNEYDSKSKSKVTVTWAEGIEDSIVWEYLDEAVTEDDYNDLYEDYGDDARAFHKKLQEFATAYDYAMATFDEGSYVDELNEYKNKSDEAALDDKEELSSNDQGALYIAIYEELENYKVNSSYTLGEYLLEIGHETSDSVDLTRLYPVIDSMTYAQRLTAGMSGLLALMPSTGDNIKDNQTSKKISEAAENIKNLIGRDSYSVWMNNNEEIKDKKVAYTSDAIRMDAAQKVIDDYDSTSFKDKADEIMKWVNLALGIVSCVLILAKFQAVATVLALIPAGICAIAAACGLTAAATTVSAIAAKIAGAAAAAGGPVGWIILGVLVVSMIVIWAVTAIIKYKKENEDSDYDPAPDYVADCIEINGRDCLTYYKGVGSERQPAKQYKGKIGIDSEEHQMDYHGEDGISDVNGRMGFRGWNCMFYSKDENTGSPIVIKNGECPFKITYGNGGNAINGYDNVKSFGQITPGNCNALMKKDDVNGIFIHYRTEKSYQNGSGSGDNQGSKDTSAGKTYYKDIIVRSADTEELAKAKITAKGYKIWDYNIAGNARYSFSRHKEWAYTFIGYTETSNPKNAITDIRVAPFYPASNKELSFGDVKYGCAGNLGYKAESATEDKEYPGDLDGLWITTDANAGTPIEVDKLHIESDHNNGKYVDQGWVPVTTFSGVPYNFASTRDSDEDDWEPGRNGNFGYRYTCYQTDTDNKWNSPAKYIYYEPETKYTSGTKYLSALFFTFGTDSESTAAKVGEVLAKYGQLADRIKKTPNTEKLNTDNLAESFYYKGYIVESNQKYLDLWYSWSYNPYRALTDIKAFQGTILATELPYSLKKTMYDSGSNTEMTASYDAVTVISQRTTTKSKYVTRGIGPENAYMSPNGLLGTNKEVPEGYTSYQPGGYPYSVGNMPFIQTGLYVSGPVNGAAKLTLNDIVATGKAYTAVNSGGIITTDVSREKTLAGKKAAGEFNSIKEMKAPGELSPFDISYPAWTDDSGKLHEKGTSLYVYLRKPNLKKKYISKVFVGSFSFEDSKQEEGKEINHAIAKQVDLNALVMANGEAADEVVPVNVAVEPGRAWYDAVNNPDNESGGWVDMQGGWYLPENAPDITAFADEDDKNRLPFAPPYYDLLEKGHHNAGTGINNADFVNRPASYISVTRTDDPEEAIKGILLYKADKDAASVAEKIQVDGVTYQCASASTPIVMMASSGKVDIKKQNYKWKTQKYFLYYTKNRGVSPGQPITDITVDGNVFNSKQITALCVDKKDKVESGKDGKKTIKERAKPYGEGELSTYIHASYEDRGNMFFNKIYTANGSTKKEALLKLLEQGCTEFLDLNLNEGAVLSDEEREANGKRKGGDYIYFGYRGYTLDEEAIRKKSSAEAKEKELDEQLEEAVYDIICTVGEDYHSEGIMTDRYQIYYTPVVKAGKDDDLMGTDLNAGTNGPPIYMYYTTPYSTNTYNKRTGKDVRKNLSSAPKDYLKSPITSICFTRYDRVPYSQKAGNASSVGDDKKPWEFVLYSDYSSPVDLNDGAVVLDNNWHMENNHISMFVQREDGFVKPAAEITGGYLAGEVEVGEMWVNQ